MLHGTLITAAITKDFAILLSDGRAINIHTGEKNDRHSKVHQLSPYVGLLVAGIYLPNIPDIVRNQAKLENVKFVEDMATIVQIAFKNTWEEIEKQNPIEVVSKFRAFALIVGFDRNFEPHIFYVDNNSKEKFELQERVLDFSTSNLHIACMAVESSAENDPTKIFIENLVKWDNEGFAIDSSIQKAFDHTKEILSQKYDTIGGETFSLFFNPRTLFSKLSK